MTTVNINLFNVCGYLAHLIHGINMVMSCISMFVLLNLNVNCQSLHKVCNVSQNMVKTI